MEVISIGLFVKFSLHTVIKGFFTLKSTGFDEFRYYSYNTFTNLKFIVRKFKSQQNAARNFLYCIIEFTLRNVISVTALLSSHFATLSALLHYWVHTLQRYQRYCIMELTFTGVITVLLHKVIIFQAFSEFSLICLWIWFLFTAVAPNTLTSWCKNITACIT